MYLNRIQTDDYIVSITMDSFTSNYDWYNPPQTETFTYMTVNMTRFTGPMKTNPHRMTLFDKYTRSDDAVSVFELYTEAWDEFLKACQFCDVSPVSDGTCANVSIGA